MTEYVLETERLLLRQLEPADAPRIREMLADEDARHSAQTVFGIIILGVGPVVAAPVLQWLTAIYGEGGQFTDYSGLWYTLSAVGLATAVLVAVGFRDETRGS